MNQNIVIDLDALLDTRLALISLLDAEWAAKVTSNQQDFNVYANRIDDEFEFLNLGKGGFKETWRTRVTDLLPISMATALTYDLKNIIVELIGNASMNPAMVSGIEITVNLWPYTDLSDVEIKGIVDAIDVHVGQLVDIKTICKSPQELTPRFFKDNDYVAYFTYDLEAWLNCQYNVVGVDLEAAKMPRFSVVAPFIVVNKEDLREAVTTEAPNGETVDIRTGIQFTFADFFKLEVTDIGLFSIASPGQIAYQRKEAYKNERLKMEK